MTTWVRGSDIDGLPGIPAAGGSRARWAKRIGVVRRTTSFGKGWEYAVESLPAEAQQALALRAGAGSDLIAAPAGMPEPVRVEEPTVLADWQRNVARARLEILRAAEEWQVANAASTREAFEAVAERGALNGRSYLLEEGHARRGGRASITTATLYRWARAVREAAETGGDPIAALAPAPAGRRAPQPDWLKGVLSVYQTPTKPNIARAYRAFIDRLPEDDRSAVPPLRTVQRHIESLPVEVREYGRRGVRALRAVQPFVRRTTDGLWPMDLVTVDGHSVKCYVRRPDSGRRIRPEVTTYLDLATRRIVGYSAWWAESQYAIWLALRAMVVRPENGIGGRAPGVPAIQYSDNGAYRGEQHQAVLARLGCQPMYSLPYRAQARGAIERLNSSVWVPLARTQPTYCGKDTDAEKFKAALRRVDDTGAGILEWADWLAWQIALDEGWEPTELRGDDLHDLLPAETRKCLRGEVRLPWGLYQDQALRSYHDRLLRLHYDPADGDRVWVCEPDGRLICVARRDAAARPYVPRSALDHAREQREKARVGRLERQIAIVRDEETPLLEGQTYDLPDLVMRTGSALAGLHAEPEVTPLASRAVAHHPASEDTYLDALTSDPARYEAWRILRERERGGELLSLREQEFVVGFGRSGYAQAMEQMRADFDRATGGAGSVAEWPDLSG